MVCKRCGKEGHNSRTCSQVKKVITKKKRKYVCKLCGGQGHSKKTCRKRSNETIPQVTEVLDAKEEELCVLEEEERESLLAFLETLPVDWEESMNWEEKEKSEEKNEGNMNFWMFEKV